MVLIYLGLIGVLLSVYAAYEEFSLRNIKGHKAICDISDKISCSKAFLSEYGKLFGVSNSVFGIFFYLLIIILTFVNLRYIFYLSLPAFFGTLYLAYISYFKLRTFCLVCTGVYLINVLLLVFSYFRL